MSTATVHAGGLVGLFRKINLPSLAPLSLMTRLAGIAAVVLIVKKSNLQNISGANWDVVVVALALGLVAVVGEYQFARETYRAWREREVPTLVLCTALWAAAFAYSCNNWLGVASEGQVTKANVQKAAYVVQQDTSKTEAELTAKNNDLLQRIAMAPKRTAEQAEAAIVNAKANRFWNMTNGCTETKGPQTRAFCDAYASAVADKAGAIALITDREEQRQVAAELRKLRETRKDAPVVDEQRSDLMIYTSWLGVSQQNAVLGQAVGMIAFVSLLLSGLGLLKEREEYAGKPTKPWGIANRLRSVVRWFKGAIYGRDAIKGDTYVIDDTAARQAAKAAFARYAGAN